MSENAQKDYWEKAEIAGKIAGAVLVPIVIGILGWHWNSERTKQSQFAKMTEVAVEILQANPADKSVVADDYIRDWAISVLQSPDNPPVLTAEAAQQLRYRNLPSLGFGEMSLEKERSIEETLNKVVAVLPNLAGTCFWTVDEPSRKHKEFLGSHGFQLVGEFEGEFLFYNEPADSAKFDELVVECSDPELLIKF